MTTVVITVSRTSVIRIGLLTVVRLKSTIVLLTSLTNIIRGRTVLSIDGLWGGVGEEGTGPP